MRFAGLTLSALLFAGTIFAQQGPPRRGPGAGGGAFQALKTYLSLTDAQVSNLTAVATAMRDALKPLAQDLAAKTKALRDENQKTTPDANVVAQLKQDIAGLRDQIQTQRASFRKQLQGYLNQDQLTALAKLEQVLKLFPVARAAAALDLIDMPDGPGGGRFGLGAPAGPGMMMRRRPVN
jgi:Spy/CpxP family protein refolding chaperone